MCRAQSKHLTWMHLIFRRILWGSSYYHLTVENTEPHRVQQLTQDHIAYKTRGQESNPGWGRGWGGEGSGTRLLTVHCCAFCEGIKLTLTNGLSALWLPTSFNFQEYLTQNCYGSSVLFMIHKHMHWAFVLHSFVCIAIFNPLYASSSPTKLKVFRVKHLHYLSTLT